VLEKSSAQFPVGAARGILNFRLLVLLSAAREPARSAPLRSGETGRASRTRSHRACRAAEGRDFATYIPIGPRQYLSLTVDAPTRIAIESRLSSIDGHLEDEDESVEGPCPLPVAYQKFVVQLSDFEFGKSIGGGVSAMVYEGTQKATGKKVAIKKFKFVKLNGSKFQSFQRELAVLASLNHPALLKLVGTTDRAPFCLMTELLPNGSLYHDLHTKHRMTATDKTICAFDVARGLHFMHTHRIVHRDVKSLNILLTADFRPVLCDFGFARRAGEGDEMVLGIGTPHWMAPQLLDPRAPYDAKVDVYAFGVVLWELATGETPYHGLPAAQIARDVVEKDLRPPLPQDVLPGMRDMIVQCWDRRPEVRPAFDEVVRRLAAGEAFFTGSDRAAVMRYAKENLTSGEQLRLDVEDLLAKRAPAADVVRKAANAGPDVQELVWAELSPRISAEDERAQAEFLTLFVRERFHECVALIRTARLPEPAAGQFLMEMLGHDATLEEELAIVSMACRSGVPELAAIHARSPAAVAVALNVAAVCPADQRLRPAVADKAVQALQKMSGEEDVRCAAFRALLGLKETRRLKVEWLLAEASPTGRVLATVAAAAFVSGCGVLTLDQFERLVALADGAAKWLLVAAGSRSRKLALAVAAMTKAAPECDEARKCAALAERTLSSM
jgi:serine/threonine protein kinase